MTVTINSATTIKGQTQAGGLVPTVSADFTLLTANNLPPWLSFSRTTGAVSPLFGNAMQYDQNGFLTWAPANLLTDSNTFTSWGKLASGTASVPIVTGSAANGPDGAINAASRVQLNLNGGATTGDYARISPATIIDLPPGASPLSSVWIKSNTASTYSVLIRAYNTNTTYSVGTSWQRIYSLGTAGGNTFAIGLRGGITSSDTADILLAYAQMEPVTYQTTPRTYQATTSSAWYGARLDYDPSVVPARARGLLIEEQRSNLLTYSNTFTGAGWTNNANVNVTSTTATNSPDGTQNAAIATATAGLATATVVHSATTVAASTTYTYSIYVKANVGATAQLRMSDNITGQAIITITLSTGACSVSSGPYSSVSASSESVGNGWRRYRVTGTQPSGQTAMAVGLYLINNADSLYIFGSQLEQGAFATSYMGPTTTGSPPATRAADVAQLIGPALTPIQGTSATAVIQMDAANQSASTTQGGVVWSDNAVNNVFIIGTFSNTVYPQKIISGSAATLTLSTFTANIPFKVSAAFDAAGVYGAMNGGSVVSASRVGSVPVTQGCLGSNFGTSGFIDGRIQSLAIYSTRLPDATLQTLSTVP